MRAAQELEFGGVIVNEAPTFRADQMPYGGVKDSGNTREGPAYAVRELTEDRLVVIDLQFRHQKRPHTLLKSAPVPRFPCLDAAGGSAARRSLPDAAPQRPIRRASSPGALRRERKAILKARRSSFEISAASRWRCTGENSFAKTS